MSASIARQIVHKTPTEQDSVLVVLRDGDVKYVKKGQFNGWVIGEKIDPENIRIALWCFKRDIEDVPLSDVTNIEIVRRLVDELKKVGVPEPSVRKIVYHYRPVEVVIKKSTERYTVIDIRPKDEVVEAEAVHLWWERYVSNRGYCRRGFCGDVSKIELTAKMMNLEMYEVQKTRHVTEFRVKVVTGASQIERLLEPQLEPQPPQEVEGAPEEEPQQIEIELPEVPEVKPRELEVELTQPTQPTAVEQPKEQPQKLVKLYLLSMRLPSKYLVQKVEVKENEEVRKWEGLAAQVASRLEGIRRRAYEMIERIFCHVEEYGVWIAVTEEAVREAQKLSEWIRSELHELPISQVKNVDLDNLYTVRAVPIYLEPDDARRLLNAAIAHLSADVEELEKRIREAEEQQKRSALKRLEVDLNYRKALLEAFRRFLNSI
jgi:hypothetical protein